MSLLWFDHTGVSLDKTFLRRVWGNSKACSLYHFIGLGKDIALLLHYNLTLSPICTDGGYALPEQAVANTLQ